MELKKNTLLKEIDELLEKGLEKDEILKKVNIDGLPKKTAREIFTKIDDFTIKKELVKQTRDYSKGIILSGLFIFLVGIAVTVVSFINGTTKFVIAIGLILSGIAISYFGYSDSKIKDDEFKLRARKIKKSKFNKY